MSVLIKGMKMPKTCAECDFCHWSNLHQTCICDRCDDEPVCADYGTDYKKTRARFCPLVEIPVPHGDLIDKEKLYNTTVNLEAQALAQTEKLIHSEDISEWKRWSAILNERTAFKHDLLDAQIVIEAEEEQEE